jgi:transcription-repair coupling factor (superfamily II helicase)
MIHNKLFTIEQVKPFLISSLKPGLHFLVSATNEKAEQLKNDIYEANLICDTLGFNPARSETEKWNADLFCDMLPELGKSAERGKPSKRQSSSKNKFVYFFPSLDKLPFEDISPSAKILAKRVEVLSDLKKHLSSSNAKNETIVVSMSIQSLIQRFTKLPDDPTSAGFLTFKKGIELPFDEIKTKLVNLGYSRTELVTHKGEFAVRGDIFDIFPPNKENPVRVNFFADEIESIFEFSTIDQLTGKNELEEIELYPFVEQTGELISISEMFKKATLVLNEPKKQQAISDKIVEISNEYLKISGGDSGGIEKHLVNFNSLLLENRQKENYLEFLDFSEKTDDEQENSKAKPPQKYFGNLELFAKDSKNEIAINGKNIIVCISNPAIAKNITDKLENAKIIISKLTSGFSTRNENIFSQQDLFGKQEKPQRIRFLSASSALCRQGCVVRVCECGLAAQVCECGGVNASWQCECEQCRKHEIVNCCKINSRAIEIIIKRNIFK